MVPGWMVLFLLVAVAFITATVVQFPDWKRRKLDQFFSSVQFGASCRIETREQVNRVSDWVQTLEKRVIDLEDKEFKRANDDSKPDD